MNSVEALVYQKMVTAGISPEATIQAFLGLEKSARSDSTIDGGLIGAVVLGLTKGIYEGRKAKSIRTGVWWGLGGAIAGYFAGSMIDSTI